MAPGPRIIRYQPLSEFWANLMAEFIGTFFLIITISMSLQQSNIVGALAPIGIGFMLCAQIFAYGYLSGAIYNPAVCVALWMIQLMETKKALVYMVAQLAGGTCAALISWFLVGVSTEFKAPAPQSDSAKDIMRSLVAEFIFTFGLLTVIFNVACSRQRDNQHYGMAIAFFVIAAAFSVGGISGGAFNPAVATCLQLVNCFAHECKNLEYLWLYWVAPVGGAVCAALTFGLMHPVHVDEDISAPHGESAPLMDHDITPRSSHQATRFSTGQSGTRASIQPINFSQRQHHHTSVNGPSNYGAAHPAINNSPPPCGGAGSATNPATYSSGLSDECLTTTVALKQEGTSAFMGSGTN